MPEKDYRKPWLTIKNATHCDYRDSCNRLCRRANCKPFDYDVLWELMRMVDPLSNGWVKQSPTKPLVKWDLDALVARLRGSHPKDVLASVGRLGKAGIIGKAGGYLDLTPVRDS